MVLFLLGQSPGLRNCLEPKMQNRTKLFTSSLMILALTFSVVNSSHAAEKSPEFKAALAQMQTLKDDFTESTYYADKSGPKFNSANSTALYIYVGAKKGQKTVAYLRMQAYGGDYLFIKKVLFKVDGETFQLTPSSDEAETIPGQVQAFDWFDRTMTSTEISLVQWIINSKKTVMRIQGTRNYKDLTITSTQKKALARMLTVYKGLGGK
jgi:hypothetical protein